MVVMVGMVEVMVVGEVPYYWRRGKPFSEMIS